MEPVEPSDHALLERYLKAGDNPAFTELVRRHLPAVHGVALRVTGGAALAEEASQRVFSRLAHSRPGPPAGLPLVVWLHRSARSAAIDLVRAETRRRRREEIFVLSRAMETSPFSWEEISPVLDEVINRLPAGERGLILRRFLSGESHAAIAADLRLSEDAARMRVNRALEKLRALLERRGVHTTAAALALGLPAHASPPVASGFAAAVSSSALAAPVPAFLSCSAISAALMTKKTAFTVTAALLLAGAGALMFYSSSSAESTGGAPPFATGEFSRRTGGPLAGAAFTPGGPSAAGARGPEAEGEILHGELTAEEVNGEKLSRPLREDIASSAVNAVLREGESLVTGGYKTRNGSHEITFLTPRVIRLEDGREAIEVSARVVSLKGDAVEAVGLETIATNARNTLQHAEAWERDEVENALAAIRESAGESREGGGVSAAPKVIAMPSQPFSIGLEGEDGTYTLEAVVERGAEGGFTVRSRIEREEPPEASGKAPE